MPPKQPQYDVALSFAGEDRHHAEALASALKEQGTSVFYDNFERPRLWGNNLVLRFQEVYGGGAQHVIVFASRHYRDREWTMLELQVALNHSQAIGDDDYILLIRIDDTEIPGVSSQRAFQPIALGVDTLSTFVCTKLGHRPNEHDPAYTLVKLSDDSHAAAKRFSARIIVPGQISRRSIAALISRATVDFRTQRSYKTMVQERWGDRDAHVVCIFAFTSLGDEKRNNWVCRSQWIDTHLRPDFRPQRLAGEDISEGLVIDWSETQKETSARFAHQGMHKSDWLFTITRIVDCSVKLADAAATTVRGFREGTYPLESVLPLLAELITPVDALDDESSGIGLAPVECSDLNEVFQCLLTGLRNVLIPFGEGGAQIWPSPEHRLRLAEDALKTYAEDLAQYKFELTKVL